MKTLKFTSVNGDLIVALEEISPEKNMYTFTANFKPFNGFPYKAGDGIYLSAYLFNDKTEQLIAEVKEDNLDTPLLAAPPVWRLGATLQGSELIPDIKGAKLILATDTGPIQLIASEVYIPEIVTGNRHYFPKAV